MRIITSILLTMLAPLSGYSQLAPDFSVTDTEGVTWNLHDQLAQGKTVVLDFFYVDCVPCQGQSPEVAIMYDEYLAAGADLLVLGISNRDDDVEVEQFDLTYNITYPTAGTEGGGDTITELYQSWFQFFGWPSYGVVCPDTTINWGIFPSVPGVPEIRTAVDVCLGTSSVYERISINQFVRFREESVEIISNQVAYIHFSDLLGRRLTNRIKANAGKSVHIPSVGIAIITIQLANHQTIHQKIYR
jgi:peroxiredoxin